MKHITLRCLLALLVLVCAVSLIACGEDTPTVTEGTTTAGSTESTAETTTPIESDLVIVSGGEAKLPLIRAEDASDEVVAAISKLYSTIREVTGVKIDFTTDYIKGTVTRSPEEDKTPAILAGPTNYSAGKAALGEITYGQGLVRVVGDQLIIAVADQSAAVAAVNQLCEYVEENGKKGELSFPRDYALLVDGNKALMSVPTVEGAIAKRTYDVGDGAVMLEITQVTSERYQAYLPRLEVQGLTKYASSQLGDNLYLTYTDAERIYNYLYTPSDKTLRVVVDKKTATALPPSEASTYTKVCESSVTQLGLEYNYDSPSTPYTFTQSVYQIGMCYIFRLEDGSFIILDGGFNKTRNVDMIWNTLQELSADYAPSKITIAAWFMSHAHGDHCGAFIRFMEAYGSRVDLKYFVYDSGNTTQYKSCEENGNNLSTARSKITAKQALLARPGQTMSLANAEVEMLFTDEFMPDSVRDGNSLCIEFRITIAGQSFLFGGDSDVDMTEKTVKYYGDYLKSDFVQVLHHGARGGSNAYYQAVDPTIVFWPLGEYDYFPGAAITRSKETYHTYLYESPHVKEIILAGHTDRTLALPYSYPATRIDPVRVG